MSGIVSARVRLRLASANPQPYGQVSDPDQVAAIRRLHCRRYDQCLGFAAQAGWDGFSCLDCDIFDLMSPEEEAADARALLNFWGQPVNQFDVHDLTTRASGHHNEEEH